jgi:hypothetical protein
MYYCGCLSCGKKGSRGLLASPSWVRWLPLAESCPRNVSLPNHSRKCSIPCCEVLGGDQV